MADAPTEARVWWKTPTFYLVLITLAGAGVRAIRLTFQPLWFDEGYSFYFAGMNVPALLAATAVDIHPPLYYILLKGWMALWGVGELPARAFSLVIGTLTIPVVYGLGRRLVNARAALAAAGLFALAPFHIYYSQEVRMYALVTFLAALGAWCALRAGASEGSGGNGWWLAAGLSMLAALYTQYYAVFILLALTLYLWCDGERRRRTLRPWGLTLAGVAVGYFPWVLYAAPRLAVYVRYKVSMDQDLPLSPTEYFRRILVGYGAGHLENGLAGWWPLGLVIPLLLLIGLILLRRQRGALRRELALFSGLYLGVPWLGGYLVNLVAPFNPPRSERLMLVAFPAFCLLGGAVLERFLASTERARRRAGAVAAGLFLTISALSLIVFYQTPRYPDEDYEPLAAYIQARGRPDDAVLCVFPWQVGYFTAYLEEPLPALVETPSQIYPQVRQFWAEDAGQMRAGLDELLQRHRRLWLPAYLSSGSHLEGDMLTYLDQSALRALTGWYGDTLLTLYARRPALSSTDTAAEFAGLLRADDIRLSTAPVESGYGISAVSVQWTKLAAFDADYHILFRLADEKGGTWGQWDFEPAKGARPFSVWPVGERAAEYYGLLLDAGTPPGNYSLWMSVRAPDTTPLPISSAAGTERPVERHIGEVQVVRPATPARPAALPMDEEIGAVLEGSIRLLGYAVPRNPWVPGQTADVALFWQALAGGDEELVTFVQLLDREGNLAAAAEMPPTAGIFPASRWQADDIVRDTQPLTLPAGLGDGTYRLIAGLFRAQDRVRLTVTQGPGQGRDFIELREVEVRGRPHSFEAPVPSHPLHARFGDTAELVGWDMATSQDAAGVGTLRITLHWKALRDGDRAYKVFVHLYDQKGERVGQHDGVPGAGAFPTTGWVAGEYLRDEHSVLLPAGLAAARNGVIWVGFYGEDGSRLPVFDADGTPLDDHLEIPLP